MREIVFDTETTGLDPQGGDRLVELGCVEMVNRVPTGATYHAYFNPERDMPAEAEAVHGLSAAFLADKPVLPNVPRPSSNSSAMRRWWRTTPGSTSASSTPSSAIGLEPVSRDRMVDTVAIARRKHPAPSSASMRCAPAMASIAATAPSTALLDAELLAQLYVELMGGRQIGLELAAEDGVLFPGCRRPPLPSWPWRKPPSPKHPDLPRAPAACGQRSGIGRHAEFMAGISNPLWSR
jgi:DNA polymerase-3 subunit epsilon